MATDERALRAELDALARKKEQIQATRRASGNRDRPSGNNDNQYSRANNGASAASAASSAAQRRGSGGSTGSGDRRINRQAEDRGGRLGKRPMDRNADARKVDDGNSGKRQRLSSGDAKESTHESSDVKKTEAAKENTANEREKRRAVATYAQKDGLARSRRMFGALMGHLGKAKAMIEKDSTLLKKQTSKQHEAEQKEKEQSKALEVKAKRDATVSRLENLIATAEIEMKESLARTKLEHLQQTRKGASLSRFLLTVASPPIYYLPKKHTKETEDLVAASMEAHEEKVTASNRDHQTKLQEIEAEYTAKIEKYKLELEEATSELGGDVEKKQVDDKEEKHDEAKGEAETGDSAVEEMAEHSEAKDESMESAEDEKPLDEEPSQAKSPTPASPVRVSEASPANNDRIASPQRVVSRKRASVADDAVDSSKRSKVEEADDPHVEEPAAEMDTLASQEPMVVKASTTTTEPTAASEEDVLASEARSTVSETPSATPQKEKIDVSKLRVTDLREELKKRGLDTKGNKPVLVQRLEEALNGGA